MKYDNVTITGIGSYLPEGKRTNQSIADGTNTTPEWIEERLGIFERRVIGDDEYPSDMAYESTIRALEDANLTKEDLDMIIVVTSSPEQISPSTACILNNKLGLTKDIPSFDINAVCAGFVYGMSIASPLISTGTYKNILIVATEAYSRITDWSHRNSVFFGDGSGAVILSHSEEGSITCEISANGKDTGMTGFSLKHGEKYLTNPSEVWEQAVTVLPKSIKNILDNSNTDISDIDMFIPHQASINMLKHISEDVGLPVEKLKTVMGKYGNIAGASIPIVLDEIKKCGGLQYGNKILMSAIGSGWAWGSVILDYKK
jgi:3-oxoacyl-[acyl-carrier-protein] synthase-3